MEAGKLYVYALKKDYSVLQRNKALFFKVKAIRTSGELLKNFYV